MKVALRTSRKPRAPPQKINLPTTCSNSQPSGWLCFLCLNTSPLTLRIISSVLQERRCSISVLMADQRKG